MVIDVLYTCEACSSYTYHQMKFIGYQMEALEHRTDDTAGDIEGS